MRYFLMLASVAVVGAACADEPREMLTDAKVALKKKDFAQAIKLADQVLAKDASSAAAHQVRGMAQLEMRQFDKAVADLTKSIELDPQATTAFDQRGIAYFKMAKIRESLADFDKYIELVPMAAAAHWRRGLTLYYADEFAKGVAQFTTSDKEEPNDVENAVWHFLCNARVQGLEKARGEMLKVAKDPRGPYFMKIYDLFLAKAKPEEVLAAAEAGEANKELRQEQRFYANYYIGMYYESISEPKKSLEYLKTAVEKYPIGHYMMDVARVHIKLREKA
jgi:lipoprotein NlpI